MEAWKCCKMKKTKMSPMLHFSARVPVPTWGKDGDRQPKVGQEGPRDWMVNERRGGCAACAECLQALGWQAGPCIAMHGARRGLFFLPHFQLQAPHALPSLPAMVRNARDNIASSCSFHPPSRASSLFPPLFIPSFGLDTRSRRPRPTPLCSFWRFTFFFI